MAIPTNLNLAQLFQQFQQEEQKGHLGTFGNPEDAPPAAVPDFTQQAYALPDAPQVRPTLGTKDLPAALLALLAGNQAGDVIQGYLGGKVQQAAQRTQRDQAAVERKRAELLARGQAAQAKAQQDFKAGQEALDRASQERIAANNVAGRENVAGINADARKAVAEYTFKGKQLSSEDLRFGKELAAQSADAKTALGQLMRLPAKARPGFANMIRSQFKQFENWDVDAIEALASNTAKEESDLARATEARAKLGYWGAKTKEVVALTGPKAKELEARAAKSAAGVRTEIERAGLIEKQARLVEQKAKFYEPEFRLNVARHTANIAKAQGSNDLKDVRARLTGYKGLFTVTTAQLKKLQNEILENPSLAFDPDTQEALLRLADEQEDAEKQVKALNVQLSKSGINPVTNGRVSNPTYPNQFNVAPPREFQTAGTGGIGSGVAQGAPTAPPPGWRLRKK